MRRLRRSQFLPPLLLLAGAAFYIYYGITYNAWRANLPNAIIYVVILVLLFWALRKKEKYQDERDARQH